MDDLILHVGIILNSVQCHGLRFFLAGFFLQVVKI